MAPRKTEDLEKKTMNFRKGDFALVKQIFPNRDESVMVRKILSAFLDRQVRASEAVPVAPEGVDININIEPESKPQ